jgi:hypothetical protein
MSEFFVGYRKTLPPLLARWLRRFVTMLLIGSCFIGGMFASRLHSVGEGRYAFEQPEEFIGVILEQPFPSLIVHEDFPRTAGAKPGFIRYWLVGRGKHGAQAQTAGLDGKLVALKGERVERDGQHIIKLTEAPTELANDEPHRALAIPAEPPARAAGMVRLRGEIVDSQCFLGVMKPGHGRTHRGCAVRCLSGGVPPLLHVSEPSLDQGAAAYYLLVGADGRAINKALLPFVAQTFEVEGTLLFYGSVAVLRIDPATLRSADAVPEKPAGDRLQIGANLRSSVKN